MIGRETKKKYSLRRNTKSSTIRRRTKKKNRLRRYTKSKKKSLKKSRTKRGGSLGKNMNIFRRFKDSTIRVKEALRRRATPKAEPEPTPKAEPAPTPEPEAESETTPVPEADPDPTPEPEAAPETTPVPESKPTPKPEAEKYNIIQGAFNTIILKFKDEKEVQAYLMHPDVLNTLDVLKNKNDDTRTIILYIKGKGRKDFNDKINKRITNLNDEAKNMWVNQEELEQAGMNIFERTLYYIDGYPCIIIRVAKQRTYTPTAHGGKFGFLKYLDNNGKENLLCIERGRPTISGFGGSPDVDELDIPAKTVIREMMEELFDKMYSKSKPPKDYIDYYEKILNTIGMVFSGQSNKPLHEILSNQNWKDILENMQLKTKGYFKHKLPMYSETDKIEVRSWTEFYIINQTIPVSDSGTNLHEFCEEMRHEKEVKSILSINYSDDKYVSLITELEKILEDHTSTTDKKNESLKKFIKEKEAIMKNIFRTDGLISFVVDNKPNKVQIKYKKDGRDEENSIINLIEVKFDDSNNIITDLGTCQMWEIMKKVKKDIEDSY